MEIQILRHERMSESGSSLPDMVKNKSLRQLDLFVREAIQNSLDAALDKSEKSVVEVEINVGKFESEDLNSHYNHISNKLNYKYPKGKYDFISVTDKKTEGLTGNPEKDNDGSNLQKLVYNISQPQKAAGSGGAHGLGKTTFFKLGMGIVIYYSRIKVKGEFESRLVSTLVEDERKHVFLQESASRGIAFFGKYSEKSEPSDGLFRKTIPITDEKEISKFLSLFGLEPHKGDETGTTIIVPYVDLSSLLAETLPVSQVQNSRVPIWTGSVENYLKIAVQRWYAPRISNPYYKGAWLKIKVNGDQITRNKMEPLFILLQDLYRHTDPNYSMRSEYGEIISEGVQSTHVSARTSGYVAWIRLSVETLGLTDEYYRNIYSLIGDYEAALKSPIITYARKPGMFIRYETSNSSWIPKINDLREGEIVIGVFTLGSDKLIQSDKDEKELLEEYVRSSERADHYGWDDRPGTKIIDSISKKTASIIQKYYTEDVSSPMRKNVDLSTKLSEIFLPEKSYSNATYKASAKRSSSNKRKKIQKTEIKSISWQVEKEKIIVDFIIDVYKEDNLIRLFPEIMFESDKMNNSDWEETFDKKYPIEIGVIILNCDNNTMQPIKGKEKQCGYKARYSSKYSNMYGLDIFVPFGTNQVSGKISIVPELDNLVVGFVCEGEEQK